MDAGGPGAVDHVLHSGGVVCAPVPDNAGQNAVADFGGHVGVIADAPDLCVSCGNLGVVGVAVLCDHVAAIVDQSLCGLTFTLGIIPGVSDLDFHGCIGVDGSNAHCESVNAGSALAVLTAHGADITDLVALGLHTGHDTGQVTCLINAAEIVIEVGAVGLIAGRVREEHIGIFRSQSLAGIHVTPGGGEDDIAAFLDALGHCIFNRGAVGVVDIVLADNLIIAQAESLLHSDNALIMRVAVAGTGGRVTDVNHADLDVFHRDAGAFAAFICGRRCVVSAVVVAAASEQHGQQCGRTEQSENSFHV